MLCATIMNDNVDQLIHCAQLAGVSTSTLLEGVEQIRAVALQQLTHCSPKTSVQVISDDPTLEAAHSVPDTHCIASEFVMVDSYDDGTNPTITLTLEGGMPDIRTFMQLMGRAVKEVPPRQPMLDLLRGTKGKPLHILCQIHEEEPETTPEDERKALAQWGLGSTGMRSSSQMDDTAHTAAHHVQHKHKIH